MTFHSLRVGLTGGIGSGKSSVAQVLVELGAVLIDADVVSRQVVEPGEPAWEAIRETFGEEVFHSDGTLDRKALGAIVFQDAKARRKLENIVHPAVRSRMRVEAERLADAQKGPVVLDIPLLFEVGLHKTEHVDVVVCVCVDRETQLHRVMTRDGLSKDEAKARIEAQWPLEEKVKLADFTLDNRGSPEELRAQVLELWEELKTFAARSTDRS